MEVGEGRVGVSVGGGVREAVAVEVWELVNKVDVIEEEGAVLRRSDGGVLGWNGVRGRGGGVLGGGGGVGGCGGGGGGGRRGGGVGGREG